MRVSFAIVATVLAVAVTAASAPARNASPAQARALKGIEVAVKKGRIDRGNAATYRAAVNRAARLIRVLPRNRSAPVAVALSQAAAMAGKLTAPRAKAVFGQLAINNSYFARKRPPGNQVDVKDADGIVYRYFSGRCLEFHPLGNFGALNAAVSASWVNAADRMAQALADRAVSLPGGGKGWEYYFNYAGGKAPWLSGMAQAVAAQAFSGAAGLSQQNSSEFMAAARGAYRSIPGRLLLNTSSGLWIRLYGFNRLTVLNAQLQAVLSLGDYADASDDSAAEEMVRSLESSAAAALSRFDTGYWTYYALPAAPSTLSYQRYVVQMLNKLRGNDPRFQSAATRFAAYEKEPPAFKLANSSDGKIRFWLSKPASVEMKSGAGRTKRFSLNGGWYRLGWAIPKKAGAYGVTVNTRDWAGNTASFSSLPIVRTVTAKKASVWKVSKPKASQRKSLLDAAEAGITERASALRVSLRGQPTFSVGAGINDATQAGLASVQGLNTVRFSHAWPGPAATLPDPALIEPLRTIPPDKRFIVELVVDRQLLADDAAVAALAAYARSFAEQLPGLSDLLLGPAPLANATDLYVAALGTVYDAVKQVAPALRVGAELDGAITPKTTLASLGTAYGLSSRSAPIMDELAFRPAPAAQNGFWTIDNYAALRSTLQSAFGIGGQPVISLPILIDGVAAPTNIPAEKIALYPSLTAGVDEAAQASDYNRALQAAVCMPTVSGVVFRRLIDHPGTAEPGTSDQSGLYYADGTAKTSASSVSGTGLSAIRGVLRPCPGLATPVLASTLVFPLQVSATSSPQVFLACTRDCLYLATLERPDGKPVRAKRGLLTGGALPAIVQLPSGKPLSGSSYYRLRVRLVAQTNPGPVRTYRSPPLSVG